MLSKGLVEKGIGAGALLLILYTLYVRYVPQEKRKQIRSTKTGRTMLDIIVFVGTPIFVHTMAWGTLLLTLIVTAVVSFAMSWQEIKETFQGWWGKRKKEKTIEDPPNNQTEQIS